MKTSLLAFSLFVVLACTAEDCTPPPPPTSSSGVRAADVKIETGSDGLTVEQRNVKQRLVEDNKPGSIKHLYVISAYSGQVILYSTVRGKVSSSGKRLHPDTIDDGPFEDTGYRPNNTGIRGFFVQIGQYFFTTRQVLSDDGTYGSSVDYIYWFDVRGVYHQHYVSGGQIVHISDQPIATKSIILNLEQVTESK